MKPRDARVGFAAPLFNPGFLAMTPGVQELLSLPEVLALVHRHVHGDWGDLDAEDRQANASALRSGGRLLSAYRTLSGDRVWVITEADRSSTTVLLPSEY